MAVADHIRGESDCEEKSRHGLLNDINRLVGLKSRSE
jgi:hypothetical protein